MVFWCVFFVVGEKFDRSLSGSVNWSVLGGSGKEKKDSECCIGHELVKVVVQFFG